MKMSPQFQKAFKNMQPGIIVKNGFLGTDDRMLLDIIEKDEEHLRLLNIELDDIIDKLNIFKEEAKKGLGEPRKIDEKWLVRIDDSSGILSCPFEDGIFYKNYFQICNLKNNKLINLSDLSIHMIHKHHFFQGKGSMLRIEPEELIAIFD